MRGRGPDIFAVILNIIPAPIIITRRLPFKAFLSLAKISPSRLTTSLRATFSITIYCGQLKEDREKGDREGRDREGRDREGEGREEGRSRRGRLEKESRQ
jgi:hypothetical protein